MARVNNNLWNRYKYKINALVLLLSVYFLYQSLNPKFPDTWNTQKIGLFEITPMPFNLEPPYLHDGHYTKDFFLVFSQGKIDDIRQAYLNIGSKPLPLSTLQAGDSGILHGSQHGQEVHAIAPKTLKTEDKVWLTIENWQGEQVVTYWELPKELLPN
ncbi:MAG: hypothetical protein HRT51_15005 [Colwellia sp.]|nr:hypothetical protein [Colwellia sp.]